MATSQQFRTTGHEVPRISARESADFRTPIAAMRFTHYLEALYIPGGAGFLPSTGWHTLGFQTPNVFGGFLGPRKPTQKTWYEQAFGRLVRRNVWTKKSEEKGEESRKQKLAGALFCPHQRESFSSSFFFGVNIKKCVKTPRCNQANKPLSMFFAVWSSDCWANNYQTLGQLFWKHSSNTLCKLTYGISKHTSHLIRHINY